MKIEIIESKNVDDITLLVEEVQNLHAGLFPAVYKPFQQEGVKLALENMLSDDQSKVLIAKSGNVCIGYMLIIIKDIPDNAFHYAFRILHIDQIAVLKAYQQTGVGSLLIEEAEKMARQLSAKQVELDHLHINTDAANFFKRKAFKPYREKLFKIVD
ncbi:MAG: GNAT family N-acetyltransferase [Bacteroidota bacterium]